MLHKLLNVHKLKPFSRRVLPNKAAPAEPEESGTSILKIVHGGGHVESHYMAIPAAKILEKYPSFLLTRPEFFRRPWDSVVRPDEILTPGKKFFLVPRRTVRKLRHKIRRPPSKEFNVNSFLSQTSIDVSSTETLSQRKDGHETLSQRKHCHGPHGSAGGEVSESSRSCSSIMGRKKGGGKKHVTFSGIDVKHKDKKGGEIEQYASDSSSSSSQSHGGKRRVRNVVTWQPTLTAITETQGNDVIMK